MGLLVGSTGTGGSGAERGGLCFGDTWERLSIGLIGGGVDLLWFSREESLTEGNKKLRSSESGPTIGVNILRDLKVGAFSMIGGG